jgi:hypothetical protein
MKALERIEEMNKETVFWKTICVSTPPYSMGGKGSPKIVDVFLVGTCSHGKKLSRKKGSLTTKFDEIVERISSQSRVTQKPKILYSQILTLISLVKKEGNSFYWEKRRSDKGFVYAIVYLESLVPLIQEKKTVFVFREIHIPSRYRQKALDLLDQLCSEKEDIKQYWKDVPDAVYKIDFE